jgi:hypothetical protein
MEAVVAQFRYYRGICLEELRKTIRQSPGRDLNPGPTEYDARMLTTRPRSSVIASQEGCCPWSELVNLLRLNGNSMYHLI